MKLVNSSQENSVFMYLRKKIKGSLILRDWGQNLQTFRLTFILSNLSVTGIFNINIILSHV